MLYKVGVLSNSTDAPFSIKDNNNDKSEKSLDNWGNAIGEKIRQKLHSHHAARVSKGSLYSHATQISHDGIMEFHGQTTIFKSEKAGLTKFRYRGSVIGTSRPFCRTYAGKIFNKDEIRRIWKTNSWDGKKPGDPMIVRGGYNCRHHWRPIV